MNSNMKCQQLQASLSMQDPNRESDNVIAHSVLIVFYESLLPVPSSFELPPQP